MKKFALALLLLSLLQPVFSVDAHTEGDSHDHSADDGTSTTTEDPSDPFNPVVGSFLANVLSEFGDKTFLVTAVMAMKYDRRAVMLGGGGGLTVMTFLGCVFGYYATAIISPRVTHFISGVLFLFFGGKMLYDAYLDKKEEDEEDEVQKEVELLDAKLHGGEVIPADNENPANRRAERAGPTFAMVASSTFTQIFLAEFGDKSQIATVALAARYNAFLIFVGSSLGLIAVTGVAVLGGKLLAEKVSPRALAIAGGVLFLLFGLHSFFFQNSE